MALEYLCPRHRAKQPTTSRHTLSLGWNRHRIQPNLLSAGFSDTQPAQSKARAAAPAEFLIGSER